MPSSNLSAARLAQSAERKALNLVVVGSSTTVGVMQQGHGFDPRLLQVKTGLVKKMEGHE